MFRSVSAVAVYVTDIARAKAFYCDLLQFELVVDVTPELSFLRSRSGNIQIYLQGGSTPASPSPTETRLSFFLRTDLPTVQVFERLRAGGSRILQEAPEQVDDRTSSFQFLDPDGNILEVVGPISSEARERTGDRTLWTDHRFNLDAPVGQYRETLERLRGTPARLEDRVRLVKEDRLVRRFEGKWSTQEHAGHLTDVEELFNGRLDDYEDGLAVLRPADVSGRKTTEALHNEANINEVLVRFRVARQLFVGRVGSWSLAMISRSAMHPRLKRTMRVCDMLQFQADHDDYHLARITELIHR